MRNLLLACVFVTGMATLVSAEPALVILQNGQTVDCHHPLAHAEGKGCELVQPASQYPPQPLPAGDLQPSLRECQPYGPSGPVVPCMDSGRRFVVGRTYEMPYGFALTVIGTAVAVSGQPVFVAEVIRSGGSPAVGDLLRFPLDADPGIWTEVPRP